MEKGLTGIKTIAPTNTYVLEFAAAHPANVQEESKGRKKKKNVKQKLMRE